MYKLAATKKTYSCQHCEKAYGDCIHTKNYNSLPLQEDGTVISIAEFEVLVESGDI